MEIEGIPREVFKDTNLKAFTAKTLGKLMNEMNKLVQQKIEVETTSAKQIWSRDLDEFEAKYIQHYGQDRYTRMCKPIIYVSSY